MPFKTPRFWYPLQNQRSLLSALLSPLSLLYYAGHKINIARKTTQSVPIPVICVGNVTSGGNGKTPTCIALLQLLRKNNIVHNPFFLTRGYGGKSGSPRVIQKNDTASCVGDEPIILSSHSKTITSVNRYDGADLAHQNGADCIIMDDGFQNPSLAKDISFIVIDGKTGFGNEHMIPAGPLREPIAEAIARSDAVIIIGTDMHDLSSKIPAKTPIFTASISHCTSHDKNKEYIGFAGLGHPEKFHNTLFENDYKVLNFHSFADHHPYTPHDMKKMIHEAQKKDATLITTEKDYVRIPEQFRKNIDVLKIELRFHQPHDVSEFLHTHLSSITK